MGKTNEEMLKEAKELKEKRQLMGFTQSQVAELSGVEQGNYSRMERGLLNCDKPLSLIRDMFKIEWLPKQVKSLRAEITYLNNIA